MNNLDHHQLHAVESDPDMLDLSTIVDIAIENRLLLAIVVCLCVIVGALYSLIHEPVYRADILVQIEDSTSAVSTGLLADIAPLLDVKSTADGEIQLLGSRLVVSRAVDNIKLFINARPHYFPFFGKWIASLNQGISKPGIFGFGGYVWGAESVDVDRFDVPHEMEDELFHIEALPRGMFRLSGKALNVPITGYIGKYLNINTELGPISIKITRIVGRPGARFDLIRASRLATIQKLQQDLDIKERGKDSDILAATYDGPDAVLVSRVLNEIGRQYVAQNVRLKTEEAQRSIDFLRSQVPVLADALHQSEEQYNKTRQQLGTVNLGDEAGLVLQQSVDVETQLAALKQKRLELSSQFAPTHPAMRSLNAQISDLEEQSSSLDERIKARPSIEQKVLRETRNVQVNQELYLTLQENLQQLELVKAGKVGSVRLVDDAPVPEKPIWPRPMLILPLAAIAGLFIGAGLALIRSKLFRGVSDSRDIERQLGLNVFATVPDSSMQRQLERMRRNNVRGESLLLAVRKPDDPAVESLRSFRTSLQFLMLEASNNRIMITGALPNVGKSFVSANCAALVASSGRKVLLIDADIRKGFIHRYIGIGRGMGFSDLLGGADMKQAIQHTMVEGLDFISAGTPGCDADTLLHTPRLSEILNYFSSQYDVVVIDTPPILAVSDPAMLAPYCGSVFLVALAGSTKVPELGESVKRLRQVGVSPKGVVFNRVNPALGKYGYGAAYGGYRYAWQSYGSMEADT